MAGRQLLGVVGLRAIEQLGELQVAVAVRAGDWRAPGDVLAHEVGDHVLAELRLEVDDVVRDADGGGDPARVVEIVDGAAGAERALPGLGDLAVVVELHRHTDDVVTLLGEQGRGHGRIHAAGHRYDDAHYLNRATRTRRHEGRYFQKNSSCPSCLRGYFRPPTVVRLRSFSTKRRQRLPARDRHRRRYSRCRN